MLPHHAFTHYFLYQDDGGSGSAAGGASSSIFGGAKPVDTLRKGSGEFRAFLVNSVADPGCLSRTRIRTCPSRIQVQTDFGCRSASQNLSIFNPKNCF
jgi:hypothetical protein